MCLHLSAALRFEARQHTSASCCAFLEFGTNGAREITARDSNSQFFVSHLSTRAAVLLAAFVFECKGQHRTEEAGPRRDLLISNSIDTLVPVGFVNPILRSHFFVPTTSLSAFERCGFVVAAEKTSSQTEHSTHLRTHSLVHLCRRTAYCFQFDGTHVRHIPQCACDRFDSVCVVLRNSTHSHVQHLFSTAAEQRYEPRRDFGSVTPAEIFTTKSAQVLDTTVFA